MDIFRCLLNGRVEAEGVGGIAARPHKEGSDNQDYPKWSYTSCPAIH
ncbi:MAG: hypothetical protein M0Q52_12050 [Lascolabacillus sp.]|nr:hypothetical protein [Lascolabacillus sp.]